MSKAMVEQKQKERKFLEQLLDGTKVENYTIPVPIKAELRKYQQVRKHFSRENGRARGRHACLLLTHPFFFCAHHFQAPATQASISPVS